MVCETVIIEFAVSREEGCEEAAERKTSKYAALVKQYKKQLLKTRFLMVEVGWWRFPGVDSY
jgi:hypothetical protein